MEISILDPFVRHFATRLWQQKRRAARVFVATAALSWLGVSFLTPSYDASALVQINFQKSLSQIDGPGAGSETRTEEYLNSQAMIVSSGDVVRNAIGDIGANRLYPGETGLFQSLKNGAQSLAAGVLKETFSSVGLRWFYEYRVANLLAPGPQSEIEKALSDRAYTKVLASLNVRPERKTDLIRITFSHRNPELAAQFVNVLVQKYINRHIELADNANGAGFMTNQKLKFDEEVAVASAALTTFSAKNDLYSADAQQEIILARRKDLQLKMADATGKITEREAEVNELTRQLMLLKLNTLAPQLAALARESTRNAINSLPSHALRGSNDFRAASSR